MVVSDNSARRDAPVGVFDSGVGGISVLRDLRALMPDEDFIYFGDGANAPYGEKSSGEIRVLAWNVVEKLLDRGIKALVIACNTATAAAAPLIRERLDMPVVAMEPALKPAVEKYPGGRILVMATPMTIKQEKFQALKHQFDDRAQIIGLPCEGLMEFVERGELRGSAVEAYLTEKLAPYLREPVDGIVLGCTHYPFLTGAIRRIVGPGPEIMDGSHGVAMQLERKLAQSGMLRQCGKPGTAVFENSLDEPEILALSRALFRYRDE